MGNSLWVHLYAFPHVLFNKLFKLHWNIYREREKEKSKWRQVVPWWAKMKPGRVGLHLGLQTDESAISLVGPVKPTGTHLSSCDWRTQGAPLRAWSQGHEEGSTSRAMMLPSKLVSLGPEGRWCYFYYGKCSLWILGKELGQCMECEKVSKNHDYFHHTAYSNPFPPHHVSAHIFKVEIILHVHFGFHCYLLCTFPNILSWNFPNIPQSWKNFLANTQRLPTSILL